jgi:hypothetical protein
VPRKEESLQEKLHERTHEAGTKEKPRHDSQDLKRNIYRKGRF